MTLHRREDRSIRVLAMSGSLRKASYNTGLLRAGRELAPEGMEITIFDIRDLPFYDGDIEAEGDPTSVLALKSAVRESDAVLLATPEYNWGTSAALKNAIDWASRDREEGSLMGKPATIIGAGGKSGHCPCSDATPGDTRRNRRCGNGQTGDVGTSIRSAPIRLGRKPDRRRNEKLAATAPGRVRQVDNTGHQGSGVRPV